MLQPGRKYQVGSGSYRYGFQKQETDNEIWGGAVSFKYRVEDPRVGRFFSVDPLTAKYPHNSPYAFAENRLIDGVELEGLEVVTVSGGEDFMLGFFGGEANTGIGFGPDGILTYSQAGWRVGVGLGASLSVVVTTFPAMTSVQELLGSAQTISISGGFLGKFGWGTVMCNGYEGLQFSVGIGVILQASYEESWTNSTGMVTWDALAKFFVSNDFNKSILKQAGFNPNTSATDLSSQLFDRYKKSAIEQIDKSIIQKKGELSKTTKRIEKSKSWLDKVGQQSKSGSMLSSLTRKVEDRLQKDQEKEKTLNEEIKNIEEARTKINDMKQKK